MQRVYLSGQITGLSEVEYKQKFAIAEKKLKHMGYAVFNPAKKGIVPGYQWADYMRADIKELCECDYIYQLDNWENSKGAKLEADIATKLCIPFLKVKFIGA